MPHSIDAKLLAMLRNYPKATVPKGTRLFHGSLATSPHIDIPSKCLTGSRKWLTQDPQYAVDYAYLDDRGGNQSKLLWVCELRNDLPALAGSQYALSSTVAWGASFPSRFPNEFADYARLIIPGTGPRALCDHPMQSERLGVPIYREILISDPLHALEVVAIIELSGQKASARAMAAQRYPIS